MIKQKIVATLCVVAIAIFASSPAFAYPPGRRLTIALGIDVVAAKTGQTALSIANARPGTITIQVGKYPKISVNQSGFTTKILKGYPTGIYDVKVVSPVWRDQPDEIALAKLYVPSIVAPTRGVITGKTTIAIKNIKPGTIVTVTPTNSGKKGRATIIKIPRGKTIGTISLPARTFGKGTNNYYEVAIGTKIKSKYRFTGVDPVKPATGPNVRTLVAGGSNTETILSVEDVVPGTIISVVPIINGRRGSILYFRVPPRTSNVVLALPKGTYLAGKNSALEVSIGSKVKLTRAISPTKTQIPWVSK